MEHHFAEFMKVLANAAKTYKPLATDTLRIFEETKKAAQEKKPSGGATSKARQAFQRLRNAFLNATHYGKAKAVAAVLVKETGQTFSKSFQKVLVDYAVHQQMCLEYSLLEGAQVEYRSREQGPLDERPGVIYFVEAVGPYGVSPHMLGHLYEWMYPLIARLVLDANLDRHFERVDNFWCMLKRTGFLDACTGDLSEGEARLLEGASIVREDPDALARWERFDQRFPDLDVPAGFKANCQRLIDTSHELSRGEANAMFDARGGRRLAQTETLGKLLGLPADELTKLDAVVRIVDDPMWTIAGAEDDVNRRLVINSLLLHFEDCERRGDHPSEWIPSLVPKLLREDGFIARHVPSEAAFWSLTFIALELSTFRQREETKFLRQRQTADQATRGAIKDFYQRHDLAHHTDADGVSWAGEAITDDDDADHPQGSQGPQQPPGTSGRQSCASFGDKDPILEAEFTDVNEGHSLAKAARDAAKPDERADAHRSPTANNPFEEYE